MIYLPITQPGTIILTGIFITKPSVIKQKPQTYIKIKKESPVILFLVLIEAT